jgi:hypothetical protein
MTTPTPTTSGRKRRRVIITEEQLREEEEEEAAVAATPITKKKKKKRQRSSEERPGPKEQDSIGKKQVRELVACHLSYIGGVVDIVLDLLIRDAHPIVDFYVLVHKTGRTSLWKDAEDAHQVLSLSIPIPIPQGSFQDMGTACCPLAFSDELLMRHGEGCFYYCSGAYGMANAWKASASVDAWSNLDWQEQIVAAATNRDRYNSSLLKSQAVANKRRRHLETVIYNNTVGVVTRSPLRLRVTIGAKAVDSNNK